MPTAGHEAFDERLLAGIERAARRRFRAQDPDDGVVRGERHRALDHRLVAGGIHADARPRCLDRRVNQGGLITAVVVSGPDPLGRRAAGEIRELEVLAPVEPVESIDHEHLPRSAGGQHRHQLRWQRLPAGIGGHHAELVGQARVEAGESHRAGAAASDDSAAVEAEAVGRAEDAKSRRRAPEHAVDAPGGTRPGDPGDRRPTVGG